MFAQIPQPISTPRLCLAHGCGAACDPGCTGTTFQVLIHCRTHRECVQHRATLHTHTRTQTHTETHSHTHSHTNTLTHKQKHTHSHIHTLTHTQTHTHVHTHTHSVCACAFRCIPANTLDCALFVCSHLSSSPGCPTCQKFRKIAAAMTKPQPKLVAEAQQNHAANTEAWQTMPLNSTACKTRQKVGQDIVIYRIYGLTCWCLWSLL